MNTSDILDRLNDSIAFLKGQKIIKTQQDIADKLGYNKGSVSQALNDKNGYLTKDFIKRFTDNYSEINYLWILKGEGNMINSDNNILSESENIVQEPSSKYHKIPKGVPYYDVDFTAGFLEVTNDQKIKPDSYIDHPFFRGCDYVVRASGQSMAKVICHGDAIGLIKIENWIEFFPFGEIYAIVTKDGFRMIKIITAGQSEDTYTLISKPTDSKKEEFPPQQIKKDKIMSIFKVQASSHLF